MGIPQRKKPQAPLSLSLTQAFHLNLKQVKDVLAAIIKAEDAALLRILVTRERVTVMVLVMEVTMTATEAAEEIWCVGPTTARSSATTTMRRMTAARSRDKRKLLRREDFESLLRNVYMYWIFLIMLQ